MKLHKEIWHAIEKQKGILSFNVVIICILAISGPFSLYAHAYFIDKVEELAGKDFNYSLFVYPVFLLFISLILPMLSIVSDYLFMKIRYNVDLNWNKRMTEVISSIPFYQYEHEETYDKLKQAGENNLYNIIITSGFSIASVAVSIIFYFYILINVSLWLTISVLILAPAIGYFSSKIADKQYKKTYKMNPDRRRCIYKSSILRSREYAKDIRLNRCGDYMVDDWLGTQKDIDSKILHIKFKYGLLSALVSKTEYIVILVNLLIVLLTYLKGSITLGIFISISNQIFTMRLLSKIQEVVLQISLTRSVLKSYSEIICLKEEYKEEDTMKGNQVTIEFINVSFKYPNEKEYVLKDINLRLQSGDSVAVVGENGAGKSTLIKLMLGLYSPSKGEVLINGIHVNSMPLSKRAEIFGVSFQDYSKFCLSLQENLSLNENDMNASRIARIFHIDDLAKSLKAGYSTLLGRSFGEAVDLSGGQWQIIAIARSLTGDKKVFIFDEPTASLDPVNEVETFQKISNITGNHISVFITHRLGFTTKVDRVILIKENKILEDGTFEQLINADGQFRKMFDKQRSLYIKGEKLYG